MSEEPRPEQRRVPPGALPQSSGDSQRPDAAAEAPAEGQQAHPGSAQPVGEQDHVQEQGHRGDHLAAESAPHEGLRRVERRRRGCGHVDVSDDAVGFGR